LAFINLLVNKLFKNLIVANKQKKKAKSIFILLFAFFKNKFFVNTWI